MYKDISPDLLGLIEPLARDHGIEIVDALVRRGQGRSQMRIVVDTPEGDGKVTLDACARFSRELGHMLDAQGTIPGAYLLEVTSPGVDRVLGRAIDFERAVGCRVALETHEMLSGRRRFRGKLVAFREGRAHVSRDSEDYQIPLELIARAKAFYPFEPPGKKR